MAELVDADGVTRFVGTIANAGGGLGFQYDVRQAVTLLVTPNATVLGDVSPGVTTDGIIMFAARVRNPNPTPHDLHFTGFPGGSNMDVTVQAMSDDTIAAVFQPFTSATWQVWGVDDQAATPGETGCVMIVGQTASYYTQP